jgi:hypothetical protein
VQRLLVRTREGITFCLKRFYSNFSLSAIPYYSVSLILISSFRDLFFFSTFFGLTLLTDTMWQNSSWEFHSRSFTEHGLFYRHHKNPPLAPIVRQMNPVHSLLNYSPKILSIITLSSVICISSCLFHYGFLHKFAFISIILATYPVCRQSQLLWWPKQCEVGGNHLIFPTCILHLSWAQISSLARRSHYIGFSVQLIDLHSGL